MATTWVWEGVVPYLTPADVKATLAQISQLSAPRSRLVVNYQARSSSTLLLRRAARLLLRLTRQSDPLALSSRLATPAGTRMSLRNGRVAVSVRRPAPAGVTHRGPIERSEDADRDPEPR